MESQCLFARGDTFRFGCGWMTATEPDLWPLPRCKNGTAKPACVRNTQLLFSKPQGAGPLQPLFRQELSSGRIQQERGSALYCRAAAPCRLNNALQQSLPRNRVVPTLFSSKQCWIEHDELGRVGWRNPPALRVPPLRTSQPAADHSVVAVWIALFKRSITIYTACTRHALPRITPCNTLPGLCRQNHRLRQCGRC